MKYEIATLMAHEKYINERLAEWQNNGWEMAGYALLTLNANGDGSIFYHIPMKRKIDA